MVCLINEVWFYPFQGVGRRYSHLVAKKADVDISKRAGEMTDEEVWPIMLRGLSSLDVRADFCP